MQAQLEHAVAFDLLDAEIGLNLINPQETVAAHRREYRIAGAEFLAVEKCGRILLRWRLILFGERVCRHAQEQSAQESACKLWATGFKTEHSGPPRAEAGDASDRRQTAARQNFTSQIERPANQNPGRLAIFCRTSCHICQRCVQ